MIQGHVPARVWGFESPLRHQIKSDTCRTRKSSYTVSTTSCAPACAGICVDSPLEGPAREVPLADRVRHASWRVGVADDAHVRDAAPAELRRPRDRKSTRLNSRPR